MLLLILIIMAANFWGNYIESGNGHPFIWSSKHPHEVSRNHYPRTEVRKPRLKVTWPWEHNSQTAEPGHEPRPPNSRVRALIISLQFFLKLCGHMLPCKPHQFPFKNKQKNMYEIIYIYLLLRFHVIYSMENNYRAA